MKPMKRKKPQRRNRAAALVIAVCLFAAAPFAYASETSGTITSDPGYAWGENIGWMNFAADEGNISVTDSGLSGYIWTQNYGWINLSPGGDYGSVTNTSEGTLGGYAWSALLGPISFTGITISSSGLFQGTSDGNGSTAGRITFDCTNCSVITDWRPSSARSSSNNSSGGGGGNGPPLEGVRSIEDPVVPISTGVPSETIVPVLEEIGAYPPRDESDRVYAYNESLRVHARQSGTLVQEFTNGVSAVVKVPKGALGRDSGLVISVVARPAKSPMNRSGISIAFAGGVVFEVTARDQDGNEVRSFEAPVEITLIIPEPLREEEIGVYYLDENDTWVRVPNVKFSETTASFSVDHLTTFAILKAPQLSDRIPARDSERHLNAWWFVFIVLVAAWYWYRRSKTLRASNQATK